MLHDDDKRRIVFWLCRRYHDLAEHYGHPLSDFITDVTGEIAAGPSEFSFRVARYRTIDVLRRYARNNSREPVPDSPRVDVAPCDRAMDPGNLAEITDCIMVLDRRFADDKLARLILHGATLNELLDAEKSPRTIRRRQAEVKQAIRAYFHPQER